MMRQLNDAIIRLRDEQKTSPSKYKEEAFIKLIEAAKWLDEEQNKYHYEERRIMTHLKRIQVIREALEVIGTRQESYWEACDVYDALTTARKS